MNGVKKKMIHTSQDALELLLLLNYTPDMIKEQKMINREDVPGVWIYTEPEVEEEQGVIIEVVTYYDFIENETYQEARRLLTLLNGDRYNDHIPVEDYHVIEKALRKLNHCGTVIGDHEALLKHERDQQETLHDRMVDWFLVEEMKNYNTVTEAKAMAKNRAIQFKDKALDATNNHRMARSLLKSIDRTQSTFMVILSKLKKEYEQIHLQRQE